MPHINLLVFWEGAVQIFCWEKFCGCENTQLEEGGRVLKAEWWTNLLTRDWKTTDRSCSLHGAGTGEQASASSFWAWIREETLLQPVPSSNERYWDSFSRGLKTPRAPAAEEQRLALPWDLCNSRVLQRGLWLSKGDSLKGWREALSLGQLPLPQLVSSTASPQPKGHAGCYMHPKEEMGSHPAEQCGWVCSLLGGLTQKCWWRLRQVRGSPCGKQAAAAPQRQPKLGAIGDACLVTPNPALEAGVSNISLEGTAVLVALFLLPFFCLGPDIVLASPSYLQWIALLRSESTMNAFHARKIVSWLKKKHNFNEIKVLCENPMDRSQQFLRDRDVSFTSLPTHVLAFIIIYKQIPELMEPLFLCST